MLGFPSLRDQPHLDQPCFAMRMITFQWLTSKHLGPSQGSLEDSLSILITMEARVNSFFWLCMKGKCIHSELSRTGTLLKSLIHRPIAHLWEYIKATSFLPFLLFLRINVLFKADQASVTYSHVLCIHESLHSPLLTGKGVLSDQVWE